MRIDSGFLERGNGNKLFYEILENGFNIYSGENAEYPILHQPEPYIPNPDISYEENAKKICENLGKEIPEKFVFTKDDYLTMSANIDYLLLLSE